MRRSCSSRPLHARSVPGVLQGAASNPVLLSRRVRPLSSQLLGFLLLGMAGGSAAEPLGATGRLRAQLAGSDAARALQSAAQQLPAEPGTAQEAVSALLDKSLLGNVLQLGAAALPVWSRSGCPGGLSPPQVASLYCNLLSQLVALGGHMARAAVELPPVAALLAAAEAPPVPQRQWRGLATLLDRQLQHLTDRRLLLALLDAALADPTAGGAVPSRGAPSSPSTSYTPTEQPRLAEQQGQAVHALNTLLYRALQLPSSQSPTRDRFMRALGLSPAFVQAMWFRYLRPRLLGGDWSIPSAGGSSGVDPGYMLVSTRARPLSSLEAIGC